MYTDCLTDLSDLERNKEARRISTIAAATFAIFLNMSAAIRESQVQEQPKTTATQSEHYEEYEITAYTLHPSETGGKQPGDKGYGITASGKHVTPRRTAACPKSLPFGTRIYIPELNRIYVCEDRGGAIKGKRLDIYMSSRSKAMDFGRRKMKVEIIRE